MITISARLAPTDLSEGSYTVIETDYGYCVVHTSDRKGISGPYKTAAEAAEVANRYAIEYDTVVAMVDPEIVRIDRAAVRQLKTLKKQVSKWANGED